MNKKLIIILLVSFFLVFAGAGVWAVDWLGFGKKAEIKPQPRGAEEAIALIRRDALKDLLIDAYTRNISLKNSFADAHWKNFPARDYLTASTPTAILRERIERDIEEVFLTYKSLLRDYSADLDSVLVKRDGTPYEPGDFMKMMWTGRTGTCNANLDTDRSSIVAEINLRICGASQAKWIIYYKDYVLSLVEDIAYRAEIGATIANLWSSFLRGDDWAAHQQTASDSFGAYADVFKKAYEAPGMFGSPIPPKIEAVLPFVEPMEPDHPATTPVD